jgi:hypothetical protein
MRNPAAAAPPAADCVDAGPGLDSSWANLTVCPMLHAGSFAAGDRFWSPKSIWTSPIPALMSPGAGLPDEAAAAPLLICNVSLRRKIVTYL